MQIQSARRRWRILFVLVILGFITAKASPIPRNLILTYTCQIKNIPPDATTLDCWIPVPQSDDRQQVEILSADFTRGRLTIDRRYGNQIYFQHVELPRGKRTDSLSITIIYRVRLEEKSVLEAKELTSIPRTGVPENMNVYLAANRLIPLQGPIEQLAKELDLSAEPIHAARQIYDYLIANMVYNWQAPGAGRGDVVWACNSHTGDCSDYHSIFIGVCRSAGIPADHVFGLPLRAQQGQGEVKDWHCWARFWVSSIGWITIDASEAAKHPELRDYNFGTLSNVYLTLTHGRDVILEPNQHGDPLNIFAAPYVEIDSKYFDHVTWTGYIQERPPSDATR